MTLEGSITWTFYSGGVKHHRYKMRNASGHQGENKW